MRNSFRILGRIVRFCASWLHFSLESSLNCSNTKRSSQVRSTLSKFLTVSVFLGVAGISLWQVSLGIGAQRLFCVLCPPSDRNGQLRATRILIPYTLYAHGDGKRPSQKDCTRRQALSHPA